MSSIPLTGASLGPNSVLAIGTLVPGSGNTTNGLFLSGQGISKTTSNWPALTIAPRFGAAYHATGRQRLVVRGGAGLFFDRPDANSIDSQVQNPPTYKNITVRNGELQRLGTGAGAVLVLTAPDVGWSTDHYARSRVGGQDENASAGARPAPE